MATLGVTLLVSGLVFLLEAALLFGASFGAFLGATPMIVSGVLAMLLWGAFGGLQIYGVTLVAAALRGREDRLESALLWSRGLALAAALLSVVTGLGLAFGAFASCGPLYL